MSSIAFLFAAIFAFVGLTTAAPQTLIDDFSGYRDGDEGWPAWQAHAVGICMRGGAVEADGGVLLWRKTPYAAALTFTCELTVQGLVGRPKDWLTAGIGIMSDERNYWLLNLVRAPENQKFRHFLEFHECLDGQWLAQTMDQSRLPRREGFGDGYQWQPDRTYRFEIALTAEQIGGSIKSGGKVVGRFVYSLTAGKTAVRAGRPFLRTAGLKVRFDNAETTVTQTAPEPREERHFPPWVSTGEDKLTEGTGYFATYQDDEGRWWLVDPEGRAFFDVGTDHCNYNAHWCQKLGYAPYHRNMKTKHGSAEAWAESSASRLKQWNFNTVAAGHHPAMRHRGVCHILFASFGSGFARREWICEPIHWTGFPNVFSPDWERHCRLVARRMARESRGDPWCIGTFLDNELEWYGKHGHLVDELFRLDANHTGKCAFWDWLAKRYGDVGGLNRALGTKYADRDAFLASTSLPPASDELDAVRDAFLTVIGERYFRPCHEALRDSDRDHLIMGCRFAARTPEPLLELAGRYNDVFTINTYPRVDLDRGKLLGVQRQFRDYYAKVRKPFIITEWSFPALDSGLPCKHGAGMRVDTQSQKARCYEIFANAMIDLPFMVGYHYFMWVDEPELGISDTFPEDSNYGLVNVDDKPYRVLVETATRVNAAAHERHQSAAYSGDLEVTFDAGVLRLRNKSPWPARGKLTALLDGKLRSCEVVVPSGQTETPADLDWGKATYVLLEEWDGRVARFTPAARAGRPTAINAGQRTMRGLPVLCETDRLALGWIEQLTPGASLPLTPAASELRPVERLDLTTDLAAFRCASRGGRLFDGVVARKGREELHLGHLDFATHQIVDGQHQWVVPDKLEELLLSEHQDAWVVEAVVARVGKAGVVTTVDDQGRAAPRQTGPAQYRARVRAVVFKAAPIVLVRPLWVESLDERPWRLIDCFWFCRSAIGGEPANDGKGGPVVPNYWRRAEYWTDTKLDGAFGAISPGAEWRVHFWIDEGGGYHPDAYRKVDLKLEKGKRWVAEGWPYLWLYALRAEMEVNDIVRRAKQSVEIVVAEPGDR